MKCAKCGADCDPRQLFCLRCGTPININREDNEEFKEVEVPIEDMVNPISLDDDLDDDDDIDLIIGRDLSRINSRNKGGYNSTSDGFHNETTEAASQTSKINNIKTTDFSSEQNEYEDNRDKKSNEDDKPQGFFSDKKNVIILCSVIGVLVIAIVVVLLVFVFGGGKDYDEAFEEGMILYEKGRIERSIPQFEEAAELASSNEEKKEVYSILWEAYSQIDGYENQVIVSLNELIDLEPKNEIYYKALITVYQDKDDQNAIDRLIESITDPELKAMLEDFDGTIPIATIMPGEFDKEVSVGLTASSGNTIYYNINGGKVKTSDNVYTGAIELKEEGTYIIKAISVNANGEQSKQFEGKYVLDFDTVNPPVVELNSGKYSESKKIKVTCDEGCTIYYTTDGTVPTEESKKYTKEIKMPEKNTIYNFIAIDEKGIASDAVTRVYSFERTYAFDYNTAVYDISNHLVKKGEMENMFGYYEDGSSMYFEYVTVAEIEEEFYYIIKTTKEAENGSTIETKNYAYGCDSGEIFVATGSEGNYTLKAVK